MSGRVFGWRLAWVLPLGSFLPLTYWDRDATGAVRWWVWSEQPVAQPACWAVAALAVSAGLAAVVLTPWRLRRAVSGMRVRSRTRS